MLFSGTVFLLVFSFAVPEIVLPLGISFYTFQGMSYLLDVYMGRCAVQKNPFLVLLYIILFPQLVAGPIVKLMLINRDFVPKRLEFKAFLAQNQP